MSTAETDQKTETPERAFLVREFAAELTPGDGRTVDVRIVPYGERITHNDGLGGSPRGTPYQEEWVPGVFAGQERAANRVLVNVEHQPGIGGVVGHGLTLREAADGYYGSFRMHETPDGDKALMLVREEVLTTVSLEALPLKSIRTSAGVVQRVKAHLRNVALTRFGAYERAVVLAVREGSDEILDEAFLPVEIDPDLVKRLQAQGIELPSRYTAHPADTGTPAETGTPDDGTRQTPVNTSSEE